MVFLSNNVWSYAFVGAFVFTVLFLSEINPRNVFRGLKSILFIVIFTGFFNMFMTGNTTLFKIGPFTATVEGTLLAAAMAARIFLLIIGTTLLTFTTSPIMLTDGIEKLLNPFKKIGVPAHELAMMMTIALRFIPTLIEETDKIMKAQTARGANFETGGIIKRAKSFVAILVPLFISAFRRAEELAVAMECRCYRGGENRTRMRELEYAARDFAALGVMLCGIGIVVILIVRF